MVVVAREKRRHVRYGSSQKAVLLGEAGAGSLCLITNFSMGGLCLAVVGSSRPWDRELINLRVNHGSFFCNIVNRGKAGLHCRFISPVAEPVFFHFERIYMNGFFAGMEQIDPNFDALDATVDVLNPYTAPEERERWALGFKDAIGRLATRGKLSG